MRWRPPLKRQYPAENAEQCGGEGSNVGALCSGRGFGSFQLGAGSGHRLGVET
jgi:hypothetical protein